MSPDPSKSTNAPDLGELTERLQKAGIDISALQRSLESAVAVLRTSPPSSTLRVTGTSIAAATRGYFLPSDLTRVTGNLAPPAEEVNALLAQSDLMTSGSGRAWRLRAGARRDILVQASAANQLGPQIASLGSSPEARDGEGPLLRQVLIGQLPELDAMSLDELEQFATVAQWLFGTKLADIPTPAELRRLIGRREILDPFRTLVGRTVQAGADGSKDRVVGRARQTEQLRAYVGVLKPEQLIDYVGRTARSLWSAVTFRADANQPLLIQGIGGMGKSTLIAKFVLDHALYLGVDLPFAYLDFDRAALAPRQPLQLLIEIATQLGHRFPVMGTGLKELRGDLREAIDSQGHNINRSQREDATGSELHSFCATLRTIVEEANQQRAPVLMLFDTFEVVQYDEEAVSGVQALISALRVAGGTWEGLRVVVAGRGDLTTDIATTHDPIELKQLSLTSTSKLLRLRSEREALELTPNQVNALAPALCNSPLDVVVVTNWLKDREPQDRAHLIDELMREAQSDEKTLRNEAPPAASAEMISRRITGILIKRMIGHINDESVRELAIPGLVVRTVTPEIIREVMAPASGLSSVDSPLRAGAEYELWRRLGCERWLVNQTAGNVLRHRPEVRRAMLDLMRHRDSEAFMRTNELALAAFRRRAREDTDARAETIYHLLLGRGALEEADALWTPEAGPLLASAVDDLDASSQDYLKARLGRNVSIEVLKSFPQSILLSLLTALGSRYLRQMAPDAMVQLLESSNGVRESPALADLRLESLYRAGRWAALRDFTGSYSTPLGNAVELLWLGKFDRLREMEVPVQGALRFLLRWATRDPSADEAWLIENKNFTSTLNEPALVLQNPTLCWDFATYLCCGASRERLPFGGSQRDEILEHIGGLSMSMARLPDAAAGSDALRILAFFERPGYRPILRRVDFDNHFATISGREILALGEVLKARVRIPNMQEAFSGLAIETETAPDPVAYEKAVRRARAFFDELKRFPDDVVIADVKLTREFAGVVRAIVEAGGAPGPAILRTLALKHPDWLEPLGHALTRAFHGEVPRSIGWWASIDKYLGSGKQPRARKKNLDGRSLLSMADEASSLSEAVAAYAKLLGGETKSNPEAGRFLALANAFSAWVKMIGNALDEQRADSDRDPDDHDMKSPDRPPRKK